MKTEVNELSKLVSFGNKKLPAGTAIFNMQPAATCSGEKSGLCKLCNKCYAKKAEYLYPQVLPYRQRQEKYWNSTDAKKFIIDFQAAISKKKIKVNKLRISESGDFENQADINKLTEIAENLVRLNIVTYVHTCRSDLKFDNRSKLIVNLSGIDNLHLIKNNNADNLFVAVTADIYNMSIIDLKTKFEHSNIKKCCGSCTNCTLCTQKNCAIILCKIH